MPEYFIKDRDSDTGIGTELMNNIVYCITHNNISNNAKQYKKLHTAKIDMPSELHFQSIEDKDFEYFYNIIQEMKTTNIYTGTLSKTYISHSVNNPKNIILFVFDNDSDKIRNIDTLKSVLTFFYNTSYNCIEIDVFWSKPGGGGPLFNYLINAVKCAFSMTKNKIFNHKIFLKSVPTNNTIGFYKKFGMTYKDTPDELIPFTRELSVESVNSAKNSVDKMSDIAIHEDLQWLMDNIDVLKKDTSPKKPSPKKISSESPEYYIDIDKYKEQKINSKTENRKRLKENYNLRKLPTKSSVFLQATKALKEYTKNLNKMDSTRKKSVTRKIPGGKKTCKNHKI